MLGGECGRFLFKSRRLNIGLELINSIMERFLDFLQPNLDPRVKIIKDLLSAFVLLIAFGAAIIGILIFWPHFKTIIPSISTPRSQTHFVLGLGSHG